ncbi:hypothetical protein [Bradyrhizobium sp. RT5a]|uniref:hypothetical protein n=1 Tax=Bradyrhizobium sp. RT5a TaxID=3156380 RepID=UPI0033961654
MAESDYRAKQFELVAEGSREPFFLHLFRGCVLKSAPGAPTFSNVNQALGRYSNQLRLRGPIRAGARQFDTMVASLAPNMDIDQAIYSCAQTRNTIGHNLVWSTTNLNPQTYAWLVKNIGVSCIHAISKLYP